MKLKLSRPSPSMLVACVALFVALGGTSYAAVSYATNAGKVDGKDAVYSGTSLSKAAGDVVATNRSGSDKGKIPAKFLAGVPTTQAFGRAFDVADNATGAQEVFGGATGVGSFSANCSDQNARAGVEDPITALNFTNQSGETINLTQRRGTDAAVIQPLPNGTVATLTIGGSNTFEYQIQKGTTNLLINGTVRQDGRAQAAASCLVYGTILRVDA